MDVRHTYLFGHAFTYSMLYKPPHCTISHGADNGKVLRSSFVFWFCVLVRRSNEATFKVYNLVLACGLTHTQLDTGKLDCISRQIVKLGLSF